MLKTFAVILAIAALGMLLAATVVTILDDDPDHFYE